MGELTSVEIELRDGDERRYGTLLIATLPTSAERAAPPLLDLRSAIDRNTELEPIQLMEGCEYRYAIELSDVDDLITNDHPDVFHADDPTGHAGRLRTGMYVGRLPVGFLVGTNRCEIAFEVRSRKLDYMTQYRWMLRDISEGFTEAIMERFAATQQRFGIDESANARTLYQRFAFLQSLLKDEAFSSAIRLVLHRPYVAWTQTTERRHVSRGIRIGSSVGVQLSRPGPRVRTQRPFPTSYSLPTHLDVTHSEETTDNPPNRFVKFALTRWREDVNSVLRILSEEQANAPVRRGISEATTLLHALDEILASPLFADVGRLDSVPSSNPVLLKKAGYREIARAYVQLEMASKLGWDGGDQVYEAGQRNVATLYEFWCFIQVAKSLASLCEVPFDFGDLLESRDDGLNLVLARGQQNALKGRVTRLGRELECQLWFNRSFTNSTINSGSWSRPMRPDCSILIRPVGARNDDHRSIWIHFDAKYRADNISDLLGAVGDPSVERDRTDVIMPLGEDLLKMHTYRDAIRRSAGAYVLYPGTAQEYRREYHELLPGLGAFALSPSEDGIPLGKSSLVRFLDDVVTHAASQLTQHERGRFWERASYSGRKTSAYTMDVPFLDRPPADSTVLLGFVKSRRHYDWIVQNQLYNLRADDRTGHVDLSGPELAADYILLYGPSLSSAVLHKVVEMPRVLRRDQLANTGYPGPRGLAYFCLCIAQPAAEWRRHPGYEEIRAVIRRLSPSLGFAEPLVVSWEQLLAAVQL